jgi:hypothetical protein
LGDLFPLFGEIMSEIATEFKFADPNAYHITMKKHPNPFVEQQKIPTAEEELNIVKFLAFNGIWLILTFGADLLSKISPFIGLGFEALIKLRYKGKWEQKRLTDLINK